MNTRESNLRWNWKSGKLLVNVKRETIGVSLI